MPCFADAGLPALLASAYCPTHHSRTERGCSAAFRFRFLLNIKINPSVTDFKVQKRPTEVSTLMSTTTQTITLHPAIAPIHAPI